MNWLVACVGPDDPYAIREWVILGVTEEEARRRMSNALVPEEHILIFMEIKPDALGIYEIPSPTR